MADEPKAPWRAIMLALAASLVAASCPASSDAAPPPAAAAPPAPGATSRLTITDLLAEAAVRLPVLSPSGQYVAMVERFGNLDRVVRWDIAHQTTLLLLQTPAATAEAAKQKIRPNVSYLEWKSNDTLLASVEVPIRFMSEMMVSPLHMMIAADARSAPVRLNEKVHGKSATLDISWIQDILRDDPTHVMLGVRNTLSSVQIVRADIATGERVVLERGGADVVAYGNDRKGDIVTRVREHEDGSLTLEGRQPGQTAWIKAFDFGRKEYKAISKYDFLGVGEFGKLYLAAKPETPAEGDTTSVRTYDLETHTLGPVVWSNPSYDVEEILQEQETGKLLAGCYRIDTLRCDFTSSLFSANFKGLDTYFGGKRDVSIVSQSADDGTWILLVSGPDEPAAYYIYDVKAHHLTFLADRWSTLPPEKLASMRRIDFKSRDGVALSAYLSEPPGAGSAVLPLVVMPHGGPERRDAFGFDTWAQYLATRGYRVLQPNFRGSGGFGRRFAEAGYGQWGGRMHDDVMDATRAVIAEGKVDAARVCIVGASYGGYEALYAAAKEPQMFRCAISVDGLSDLIGDLKWERSFGKTSDRNVYWLKSMGDPVADKDRLEAHSPLFLTADWKTPVLLIHGDKDGVVQVDQSRRMNRALEAAHKTVRYVEIKNMEHGPSSDEETTRVLSEMETFLAGYLQPATPTPPITRSPADANIKP